MVLFTSIARSLPRSLACSLTLTRYKKGYIFFSVRLNRQIWLVRFISLNSRFLFFSVAFSRFGQHRKQSAVSHKYQRSYYSLLASFSAQCFYTRKIMFLYLHQIKHAQCVGTHRTRLVSHSHSLSLPHKRRRKLEI